MSEGAPATVGGRYRLSRLLERGGMAEVWEAHDALLDRPVAVKIPLDYLRSQPDFMLRFRREAVAAARLNHPNVVAVYDTGSDPDLGGYIIMELVHGPSLRQVIRAEGRLDVDRAVEVAVQVATALEFAHHHGVIHRDVKPANVLLSTGGVVKVADFGIAKAALGGDDLTRTSLTLGTVRYLSPEQVESRPLDARSDIYSLGIVLYEMLCGVTPFDADSELALAVKHLTVEPALPSTVNPDVPAWLDAVVMTALTKRPGDRFESAGALRQALVGQRRGGVASARLAETALAAGPDPEEDEIGVATGELAGTATRAAPLAGFRSRAGAGAANGDDPGEVAPVLVADPELHPGGGGGTVGAGFPDPAGPATNGSGRRGRPLPMVIGAGMLVIALAAASAVALLDRGTGSNPGPLATPAGGRGTSPGAALPLTAAASFNPPPGSGTEHQDVVHNLVDGDPQTYWYTEHYANPDFGNLKSGVGAYVQLASAASVSRLVIQSPDTGWRFDVYETSDVTAPDNLPGWGTSVAHGTVNGPTTTVALPGRQATFVLLWITYLGDGGSSVRVGRLSLYP